MAEKTTTTTMEPAIEALIAKKLKPLEKRIAALEKQVTKLTPKPKKKP